MGADRATTIGIINFFSEDVGAIQSLGKPVTVFNTGSRVGLNRGSILVGGGLLAIVRVETAEDLEATQKVIRQVPTDRRILLVQQGGHPLIDNLTLDMGSVHYKTILVRRGGECERN